MQYLSQVAKGTTLLLLLSACSIKDGPGDLRRTHQDPRLQREVVPRDEPRSKSGNPDSYVVFGKRYFVMRSSHGYKERGIASWYGKKFHGRRTSSGETYNMYAMTAAHKTLPLPTYVRVTNVRNNKTIVVKVNDRGPFHDDRIIDLSYSAAKQIDMLRDGTAMVEVTALRPGDSTAGTTIGSQSTKPAKDWRDQSHLRNRIYIQVGAFSLKDNARRLMQRLMNARFTNVQLLQTEEPGVLLHRVRIGPLHNVAATDAATRWLDQNGISEYQIVIE